MLFIMVFIFTNLVSLFMNCFVAEELRTEVNYLAFYNFSIEKDFYVQKYIRQSSQIFDEVYNIEWYELKPQEAKTLIIIMCASGKPFNLTAGKFFVLSMETFAKVCLFKSL